MYSHGEHLSHSADKVFGIVCPLYGMHYPLRTTYLMWHNSTDQKKMRTKMANIRCSTLFPVLNEILRLETFSVSHSNGAFAYFPKTNRASEREINNKKRKATQFVLSCCVLFLFTNTAKKVINFPNYRTGLYTFNDSAMPSCEALNSQKKWKYGKSVLLFLNEIQWKIQERMWCDPKKKWQKPIYHIAKRTHSPI